MGSGLFGFWRGAAAGALFSDKVYAGFVGAAACNPRRFGLSALKGEARMQVVVIRSPKALRGLLKLLFKMKDS